jgi:excisionase family DNA binding protein
MNTTVSNKPYNEMPGGLMTTRELASFLKFSERHIHNMVRSRRIPRLKLGSAVRFDPVAVMKALKNFEEAEL